MPNVPSWSAPRNGLLGDNGAINASAQLNQLLGTHPSNEVYTGGSVYAFPTNGDWFSYNYNLGGNGTGNAAAVDVDQPFTMSGTSIGRVQVPVMPVGNGADLLVQLCADSAGVPGTVLNQTFLPASWISNISATGGLTATTTLLQVPQYNTVRTDFQFNIPYASPANGPDGAGLYGSFVVAPGNYAISIGGINNSQTATVTNTATFQWGGGNNLITGILQPPLPTGLVGGAAAITGTTSSVVYAGGQTSPTGVSNTAVSSVYLATWSADGSLSTWSQQPALPVNLTMAMGTASGETVYVVGGNTSSVNGSLNLVNTVYYTTLNNGQIGSWATTTPLPVPLCQGIAEVIGNWLVVIGGVSLVNGAATVAGGLYYAPINANGTIGGWIQGPSEPTALYYDLGNVGHLVAGNTLYLQAGHVSGGAQNGAIQSISFGTYGPGYWTQQQVHGSVGIGNPMFAFSNDNGTWQGFQLFGAQYLAFELHSVPQLSVPLLTTGLTNGATYHILLQQYGGTINDYLMTGDDQTSGTSDQWRPRGGGTWTPDTGFGIPLSIYNTDSLVGPLVHTWDDAGKRTTIHVKGGTAQDIFMGLAEQVTQQGPVLNMNPTFTLGTTPWTVTNGTITQSNAHVQGNLPFSALLTPTGGLSQAYIESEKVSIVASHTYTTTAWLFSPTGYSSIAMVINWYDNTGTFISSSSSAGTAIAANTWTKFTFSATGVTNAFFGTVVVDETATPPNTALLYVSAATMQDAAGQPWNTVMEVNYSSLTKTSQLFPVGVTQLS